jgi:hypothetical protein
MSKRIECVSDDAAMIMERMIAERSNFVYTKRGLNMFKPLKLWFFSCK